MARPSLYSESLVADICARLASGEPLTKISKSDDMPGMSTIYRWLQENEAFREMYARAREDQADTLADEIIAISDETMRGQKTVTKADGSVEITEGDMIEHRRLRVDARKWIAAKLRPKKYGDKTEVEHTGDLKIGVVSYAADRNPT